MGIGSDQSNGLTGWAVGGAAILCTILAIFYFGTLVPLAMQGHSLNESAQNCQLERSHWGLVDISSYGDNHARGVAFARMQLACEKTPKLMEQDVQTVLTVKKEVADIAAQKEVREEAMRQLETEYRAKRIN